MIRAFMSVEVARLLGLVDHESELFHVVCDGVETGFNVDFCFTAQLKSVDPLVPFEVTKD